MIRDPWGLVMWKTKRGTTWMIFWTGNREVDGGEQDPFLWPLVPLNKLLAVLALPFLPPSLPFSLPSSFPPSLHPSSLPCLFTFLQFWCARMAHPLLFSPFPPLSGEGL